jgi:hypothetical protein
LHHVGEDPAGALWSAARHALDPGVGGLYKLNAVLTHSLKAPGLNP